MSSNITPKIIAMLFAGVVAAGTSGGGVIISKSRPSVKPPEAPRMLYVPRPAAARSWGGLSPQEVTDFSTRVRAITASRVEIYCNGNYCRDLAEDLDEAFEAGGFDSYIEHPMFDLGKGMAIAPDTEQTRAIATALRDATGGRLALTVMAAGKDTDTAGKIVVAIARNKAPDDKK